MSQAVGGKKYFHLYGGARDIDGYQHVIVNYSIAHSATATVVTISSIQEYLDAVFTSGTNAGTSYATATASLSATGQSTTSYSEQIRVRSGASVTLGSRTLSWSRGTSAQTKTITVSTGLSNSYGENSVVSFNITVPALDSYAVTYNANSGSGAPTSQTKYYGINLGLSSVRPSKSGYTFKGWATSVANANAGTVNYNPGATYTGNAALSLYAVWELTYSKPAISGLSIERCKSDGTLDDEGGYAKVTFNWSVFRSALSRYYGGSTTPYSSNAVSACTITITDGTITKTATPTLSGASGTDESVIVGDGTFDADQQYSVTISITDSQTTYNDKTTTMLGTLAKGAFPMDINRDATALGLLMPAPDNAQGIYFGEDIKITLPKYQTSGESDKKIYDAIVSKGWSSYVLDGNVVSLKKLLEKMLT